LDYIHLNPARARLIAADKGESILDYRWSSLAGGYALPPEKRAKWFSTAAGLEVMGLKDSTSGRREMVARLNRRILEEEDRSGLVPLPAEVDAWMSHLPENGERSQCQPSPAQDLVEGPRENTVPPSSRSSSGKRERNTPDSPFIKI
jgi:hypothetical protein